MKPIVYTKERKCPRKCRNQGRLIDGSWFCFYENEKNYKTCKFYWRKDGKEEKEEKG